MAILEKILEIKKSLSIEKTGYDTQNDYHYFRADDVAAGVRKSMNEHGVIHRTRILSLDIDNHWDKQGRNRPRVTSHIEVTFIDPEDGSEMATEVVATGGDIGGDKAPRKMMVQAFKEACIDVFTVAEGMQGMDSDSYAPAEADVPAEVEEVEKPELQAKVSTKELGARVKEILEDDDNFGHVNGEIVNKVGQRLADSILGSGARPTAWRKDREVLEALIEALEKGEVE